MEEVNQQKELVSQSSNKRMSRLTKLCIFLGLLIIGMPTLGFIVQISEAPESPGLMVLPMILFGLAFWGGIGYLILRSMRSFTNKNDK